MTVKPRNGNANNERELKAKESGIRKKQALASAVKRKRIEVGPSQETMKGYEFAIMGWCLISWLGGKEISGSLFRSLNH